MEATIQNRWNFNKTPEMYTWYEFTIKACRYLITFIYLTWLLMLSSFVCLLGFFFFMSIDLDGKQFRVVEVLSTYKRKLSLSS